MYPKILKHGLPALRLEFMVLSRFIMYYRVFIVHFGAYFYTSARMLAENFVFAWGFVVSYTDFIALVLCRQMFVGWKLAQ